MLSNDLFQRIKNKSDKELIRLLFFEKKKYTPEAIKLAKQDFNCRNLVPSYVKSIKKEISRDRRKQHRENSEMKGCTGCLDFGFFALFEWIGALWD